MHWYARQLVKQRLLAEELLRGVAVIAI